MVTHSRFGHDDQVAQVDGLRLAIRSYSADQSRPMHTHENLSFFLVLAGGMTERCGSQRHEIRNFKLVAQSNRIEHSSVISDQGMRGLFLQPSASWLERHSIPMSSVNAYEIVDDARVVEAMGLAVELSSGAPEQMRLEERVLELCSWSQQGDTRGKPKWLNAVLEMLHEGYDKPLSLAQLAEFAGVHPVHLARVFKANTRRSVSGYLRALRVKEALRKSKRMPLGLAAIESGFADQSHFCRSVRRELRLTPSTILAGFRSNPVLQSFYR
jgi:AraC family transcriptional regulator